MKNEKRGYDADFLNSDKAEAISLTLPLNG